MSRTHRLVRLAILCLVLLNFVPQYVRAADQNANRIAEGLTTFAVLADTVGTIEQLSDALPLTAVSPASEQGLRLKTLFQDSLTRALQTVSSYESLAELRDTIDAADGSYGGVTVSFDNVVVQPSAADSRLIDLSFGVTARRAATLPLAFAEGDVRLSGGGIATELLLSTTLDFQLNTTLTDPAEALQAFYLKGEPTIAVGINARGTGGSGTTIGTINALLGFTTISATGEAALDLDFAARFTDPDSNGRISEEEWLVTALGDLVTVAVVDDPATIAVAATLRLDSSLIAGGPDGTVALSDPSLADGLTAPTLQLNALNDFTNIDASQMLSGLSQTVAGLLAAQGATDAKLPFLKDRLSDAAVFAQPLINFIQRQGDAAILCGKNNTTPPTGDVTTARAGELVYCQAIALQNPSAVTWRIKSGTGTAGVNASGSAALRTVGVAPSANAQFKLRTAGRPQVEVSFTDPDGTPHTVTPRFLSAQELFDRLVDPLVGGFEGAPNHLDYNPTTHSLTYRLKKTFDPAKVGGELDFGDQLRKQTNLIGLSPDSGASVELDASNITLDITLGVILIEDATQIVEGGSDADRFFVKVRSGADEYEFRADAAVKAMVKLRGQLGPLEVTAAGPADSTAFEIAPANTTKPMVGVNIKGTGIRVGTGTAAFTIPDAIRVRDLLGNLGDNVQAVCNMKLNSSLNVAAGLKNGANSFIEGGVVVSWPDVFGNDCVPDPSTLSVTPNLAFNKNLKVLDIAPFATGTHNGAADSATLFDSTRDFNKVPGLVGSTLRNQTDGSSCTVTGQGANSEPVCTLAGGSENDWDSGDAYEVGGNPQALLSVIIDNLERLATLVESFGSPNDLDKKLAVVNVTPRELIGQFRNVRSAINDIRSGPSAAIVCGTQDTSPPTGDVSVVRDGTPIYCRATTLKPVEKVIWTIKGGTAGARTSGQDASATVDRTPSANAVFTVNDGDASTPTTDLNDYAIRLSFTDTNGNHSADFPVISPNTLQGLERLLESKLNLPPQVLEFTMRDLPLPGQTGGDGVQDLVISLGYGICTSNNSVINACTDGDTTVARRNVPVNLDLDIADLIQVESESSLQLEYAARARLDIAVPLASTFNPGALMIIDSTGVTLEVGAASDNLNLSASFASLGVKLGNTIEIAQGQQRGGDGQPTLSATGVDFSALNVPVGAQLRNETDGSSCSVTSLGADSTPICTLAGGSENDWDNGDQFKVFGVGTAKIGARLTLNNPGSDGRADGGQTFALSQSYTSGLKVTFDGPNKPASCGQTNPSLPAGTPSPSPLTGDACAKLSIGLVDGDETSYVGDIDFRIEDLTATPDALADFGGWYASVPEDLADELASRLLDWSLILRGIEQLLTRVEQQLDGAASGASVPLVGKSLDAGADVARTLNEQVIAPLAALSEELERLGDVDRDGDQIPDALDAQALIRQYVFEKLGPASQFKVLRDLDGDGDIDQDDVRVYTLCGSPVHKCADDERLDLIADTRITFKIGQSGTKELPFDIGLDGLPLRSAGNVKASAGWDLLLDFGLSRDKGPYLVAGGDGHGSQPELQLNADVSLGDAPAACAGDQPPSDPNSGPQGLRGFNSQRCLSGQIGFLQVTLRDGNNTGGENNPDDDPTKLALKASLDLQSSGTDQRLGFSELVGDTVGVKFGLEVDANIDLRVRTGFKEGSDIPSVLGTFHLNWGYTLGAEQPTRPLEVRFDHLHLDAGAIASRFLEPVATNIRKVTSPLQPVIDTVRAPLPVLSDLARLAGQPPISLYQIMQQTDQDLTMIDSIIQIAEFVNKDLPNLSTDNLLIPLGKFNIDGKRAQQGAVASDQAEQLITDADSRSGLLSQIEQSSGVAIQAQGDRPGAFGVPGLAFPFLDNSKQIFGLLLGKDVTLVRYEPGTLRATAGVSYSAPPIVIGPIPVVITVSGSATIEGRIAVGYDTVGLRQVLQGGSGDRLLDGIFIDDLDANGVDVPEIKLIGTVTVAAGVDIGLVAVGVEGGIRLTVGMNLNDDPKPDGKLRIDEIVEKIKNPVCLFDINGSLDAFLGAFVRIGFGFFKKTFRFEIVNVRLLDFSVDLCKPKEARLFALSPQGDLVLKIGPNASGRGVSEDQKDEEVLVRQMDPAGTRFSISAFGVYQEVTIAAGRKIIGDGGDGNDTVTLAPGAAADGTAIFFTARAVLRGGSGNDRLTSGDGNDQLFGDSENDRLDGGAGVDTIEGNAGDDVLSGALGDDTVQGGVGNDALTGGPGADSMGGGDGDDALIGGPSTDANPDLDDTITGGPGSDAIEGNAGPDTLYADDVVGCDATDTTAGVIDDISGGPDNDWIFGGAGSDTLRGDDGDDEICGNGGDDAIDGDAEGLTSTGSAQIAATGAGNDTLRGGPGSDTLRGRGGNDRLFGFAGDDQLFGDEDDDDLSGGTGRDTLDGGSGRDYLFGDDGSVTRAADPASDATVFSETAGADDLLRGGAGADALYGEGGPDQLFGDSGNDLLDGNAGDDLLRGGIDDDLLRGKAGSDQLFGDSGADRMQGNVGSDTLRGGAGMDQLEGNQDQDMLYGDADADIVVGGSIAAGTPDADDQLFGNVGADILIGDNGQVEGIARKVVLFDPTLGGDDTLNGNEDSDALYGGAANDQLNGDVGDDYLEGNAANDVLQGGSDQDDLIGGSAQAGALDGNDWLVGGVNISEIANDFDVLAGDNARISRPLSQGQPIRDTFASDTAQVVRREVTLLDVASDQAVSPAQAGGSDTLSGGAGFDRLYGQAGDDTLSGGTGDDHLEGNAGGDALQGGAGQDDLIGGTGRAISTDPASAVAGRHDGADLLVGGTGMAELADDFDVLAGDNAVIDRSQAATVWQRNTFNAAVVRQVTLLDVAAVGGPTVSPLAAGADTLSGESSDDLLYGQAGDDKLSGGPGDDRLEGNAGSDMLAGEAGNDDLVGGTGRINDDAPQGVAGRLDGGDTLRGGSGFDVLAGDNALLVRTLRDGQWQRNTFNAGIQHETRRLLDLDSPDAAVVSGADLLYGDDEDDLLYGQGNNDALHGGAGDDVAEGNAGSDVLTGAAGQDDLIGGSTQAGLSDAADTIHGDADADVILGDNGRIERPLSAGQWQTDRNTAAVVRATALYDVQTVGSAVSATLSGGDTIGGDDGPDQIFGQGANDLISGGAGFDYIEGNYADDTIRGDDGQDDLIGGGSAADGVIDADRSGDRLLDGQDRIYGDTAGAPAADASGDVIAGDNARIDRALAPAGTWRIDPNTQDALRNVVLYDVHAVGATISPQSHGSDRIFGEGGRDQIFGQGNTVADADRDGRFNEDPRDSIDNDRDGRESATSRGYDCLDGFDNDGDGQRDGADDDCSARIDEDGGGDELHGGDGPDYIEGNHGSDWIFGDGAQDDLIGGSSAGDGRIGGERVPTNLRDDDDVMRGGDNDDVLLADNGTIERATDSSGRWQQLVGGLGPFELTVRRTTMAQQPEQTGAFGDDDLRGGDGHDDLYGQLGGDYLEGNTGEDALIGDLGRTSPRIEDGSREREIAPEQPFLSEIIYAKGTLSRDVTLYAFASAAGGAGNDTLLGGDGDDHLHGGAGADIMNGDGDSDQATTQDDDAVFGGDDRDVLWGGRGHDHLWGGYGDDYLDVKPRADRADAPEWFTYGGPESFQGIDYVYGGWGQDAMQADVGDTGPVPGDRLMDWVGAYNVYYVCPGAYGERMITRSHSPGLIRFLQELAQADGADTTASQGKSGFNEVGMVFPNEANQNANPVHPDNPGHFTCDSQP